MFVNPWPVYERVLVNLTDGSAIEGLLLRRRGPLLHLARCRLHQPGMESADMDGEVFIERDRVAFIQSMPAKGG